MSTPKFVQERPMICVRLFAGIAFLFIAILAEPAAADTYQVILRGKVVMQDGSPLPTAAGIQRLCSDSAGSAPGPLTSKKGDYLWRLDVDNMLTRACKLEATLPGYISTSIDISDLSGLISSTKELPPLVLTARGGDPRAINSSDSDVPSGAHAAWKAAMKAIDAGNLPEVSNQLKMAVAAAPKFARGWHILGVSYETQQMFAEARDAYTHATEVDPKMLVSWVTLSREDVLVKDWAGASKAADTAIKLDTKRMFGEVYLHRAVALYELKDLDGAEASAKEALRPEQKQKEFRAEFVLGRILAAKGDAAGAREHIQKYLTLDPKAADADLLRGYLDVIGKPEAASVNPDLELP
jgi:Flp pilus assembly protein TadD